MMAMNESRDGAGMVSLKAAMVRVLLSVVLLVVAMTGLSRAVIMMNVINGADHLVGRAVWILSSRLAFFLLLFVGALAAVFWLKPWKAVAALADEPLHEDGPINLKPQSMSALLAMMALVGVSSAGGIMGSVLFDPNLKRPINMLTWILLAQFLLIGLFALWGLVRLKPWRQREPMSSATRRTNGLFGLSGVIAAVSCVALMIGIKDWNHGLGLFSNSPVGLWHALFAIVTWILSWVIAWWWYFSADEHEQRASDVGLLIGGLIFGVVTPVWWVAARVGLMPPPNAMLLWLVFNLIWTLGWLWRRSR